MVAPDGTELARQIVPDQAAKANVDDFRHDTFFGESLQAIEQQIAIVFGDARQSLYDG